MFTVRNSSWVVACVLAVQFVASSSQSVFNKDKRGGSAKRSANFDILDFKAYILKPINIDYKSIYPDRDAEEGPIAQALISNPHDLPIAAVPLLHQRAPPPPTPQPLRLGFQYFTDYFRNSAFNPEPHTAYLRSPLNRPQVQSGGNKPLFEFLKQDSPVVKKVSPEPKPVAVTRPPPIKRDSTKDVEVATEVYKKLLVDHVLYYPEEVKKLKDGNRGRNSIQEHPPKKLHIVVPDRDNNNSPPPPSAVPKPFYNNPSQKRKIDSAESTERRSAKNQDPIFDNVRNKTTLKITYDRVDEPYKAYKSEKGDHLEQSQSQDNVVLESPPEESSTVQSKPEEQYFQ